MTDSLWGNLESLMNKNTPKSLLKEQADHLERSTNGMLNVKIDSQGDIKGDIVHRMNVFVPLLNNYKYNLLTISHKLSIYPLAIHHPVKGTEVLDEQQFEIELGKIFKSKPVRNALEALLLQARDMNENGGELKALDDTDIGGKSEDEAFEGEHAIALA